MVVLVVVVWVRISNLFISSLAHFFRNLHSKSPFILHRLVTPIALWTFLLSLLSPPPFALERTPLYSGDMLKNGISFHSTGGGRGYGTQGHFNPAFIQGSGTTNSGGGGQ